MFELKVYIDGKDLITLPMVQNENGEYYYNGVTYYTPTLPNFDTAKPPVTFKKYSNGSHTATAIKKQNAIDIAYKGDGVISFNVPVKIVVRYDKGSQGYCEVETQTKEKIKILLVHTYAFSTSTNIPVGGGVCRIFPMTGSHLHIGSNQVKVRDYLLFKTPCSQLQEQLKQAMQTIESMQVVIDGLKKENEKLKAKIDGIDKIIHS